MSVYLEKAKKLRAITEVHYNCAQAVIVPFAEDAGMTEDAAYNVAANFGAGMKMASVCGAITGGLMVLGLFGLDNAQIIASYYQQLKNNHEGFLDCGNLLRINHEAGREKKPHCDEMVYECVLLVENILRENGKIK